MRTPRSRRPSSALRIPAIDILSRTPHPAHHRSKWTAQQTGGAGKQAGTRAAYTQTHPNTAEKAATSFFFSSSAFVFCISGFLYPRHTSRSLPALTYHLSIYLSIHISICKCINIARPRPSPSHLHDLSLYSIDSIQKCTHPGPALPIAGRLPTSVSVRVTPAPCFVCDI